MLVDEVDIPQTKKMSRTRGFEQNLGVAMKKQVMESVTKRDAKKQVRRGLLARSQKRE